MQGGTANESVRREYSAAICERCCLFVRRLRARSDAILSQLTYPPYYRSTFRIWIPTTEFDGNDNRYRRRCRRLSAVRTVCVDVFAPPSHFTDCFRISIATTVRRWGRRRWRRSGSERTTCAPETSRTSAGRDAERRAGGDVRRYIGALFPRYRNGADLTRLRRGCDGCRCVGERQRSVHCGNRTSGAGGMGPDLRPEGFFSPSYGRAETPIGGRAPLS